MSETDSAWANFVKRHRNGETNADVARRVGADASTVGRWINGHTSATPQQAISFARAYGLHPIEALVVAGYLSPSDVEGEVTIETSESLEAFSTRALVAEIENRVDIMASYIGWIKTAEGETGVRAHMSDQALRYVDPWTPPNEVKPEPLRRIFGERLGEAAEMDGITLYGVKDVGGPTEDDEDHYAADLTKEEVELAASEDDTVVDPDR